MGCLSRDLDSSPDLFNCVTLGTSLNFILLHLYLQSERDAKFLSYAFNALMVNLSITALKKSFP